MSQNRLLQIFFAIIIQVSTAATIKSLNLTASDNGKTIDGAKISESYAHTDVWQDGYGDWNIYVNPDEDSQRGFHLQIELDNSWGFHPTKTSTISLTLYSRTSLTPNEDLDVLISFSINANQYITHWLGVDNQAANGIYPACDTKTIPTQSMASGDVKSCCEQLSCWINWGEYTTREQKTSGGNTAATNSIVVPNNYDNNKLNEWPITINLINNPDTNTLFTTINEPSWGQWQQGCGYKPGFATNQGLQIYIALDDNNEDIVFQKFQIEYSYGTDTPTPSPTDNPINYPSVPPTKDPTQEPITTILPSISPITVKPTTSPTKYPTFIPSNPPSNHPTNDPSTHPTNGPSKQATTTAVMNNISPSKAPSNDLPSAAPNTTTPTTANIPGLVVTLPQSKTTTKHQHHIEDTPTSTVVVDNKGNDKQKDAFISIGDDAMIIYYMIGAVILLYCVCCIILILLIRRQRKRAMNNERKMNKYSIRDLSPSTNGSRKNQDGDKMRRVHYVSNANTLNRSRCPSNSDIMIHNSNINISTEPQPFQNKLNSLALGNKLSMDDFVNDINIAATDNKRSLSAVSNKNDYGYDIEMAPIVTPNSDDTETEETGNDDVTPNFGDLNEDYKNPNLMVDEFIIDGEPKKDLNAMNTKTEQ